jgi:hypothetical protein
VANLTPNDTTFDLATTARAYALNPASLPPDLSEPPPSSPRRWRQWRRSSGGGGGGGGGGAPPRRQLTGQRRSSAASACPPTSSGARQPDLRRSTATRTPRPPPRSPTSAAPPGTRRRTPASKRAWRKARLERGRLPSPAEPANAALQAVPRPRHHADEFAANLGEGASNQIIGGRLQGAALAGTYGHDWRYLLGAFDTGQPNAAELKALGEEQAGLDSPLGQQVQRRLDLAKQRMQTVFSDRPARHGRNADRRCAGSRP